MNSTFSTFNVLLTSVSAKISWIKAVRQAIEEVGLPAKLIGADCNASCIGKHFVDQFWQMPLQEKLTADQLLVYCQEQSIRALIPSRDGELSFLATHQEYFQHRGVRLLISPVAAIETCLDKKKFALFLEKKGYPYIPTSQSIEEIGAPRAYVVKEQYGSGARNVGINLEKQAALAWASRLKQPLFQPFIKGTEYSVDLYVNKEGSVQGTVARSRDLIVNGESHITTSVKVPEIELLCSTLATDLKLYGPAVIQLIHDEEGRWHLMECNPRFGGASSLSVLMGLNTFSWFFLECLGKPLPPFLRSRQEKQQVRYMSDLILNPFQNL